MKNFKLVLMDCVNENCPEFRHGALLEERENKPDRFISYCNIDTEIGAFYVMGDVDWEDVYYFDNDLDFDDLKGNLILNVAMDNVIEKNRKTLKDRGVSVIRFSI